LIITWPKKEGINHQIEETGSSFYENAVQKADGYSSLTGLMTLADDSGLEIDELNGQPGVKSARFAGAAASDADRNRAILEMLKNVPQEKRTARFQAVLALKLPDGRLITTHGTLEGVITFTEKGNQGFGYDPIFYLPGMKKTLAEMPSAEKNRISHRFQAMAALIPQFENLMNK